MTTKSELLQLAARITEMTIQLQAGVDRLETVTPAVPIDIPLIDITKPAMTRDGMKVGRLYVWDAANDYPIAGVVYDDREMVYIWTNTGRYDIDNSNHPLDIHNTTEDKS